MILLYEITSSQRKEMFSVAHGFAFHRALSNLVTTEQFLSRSKNIFQEKYPRRQYNHQVTPTTPLFRTEKSIVQTLSYNTFSLYAYRV